MDRQDLNTLPEEVQDFIWNVVSDVDYDIEDKFSLDFDQSDFVSNLQNDIILKRRNVLDLPKYLEKLPNNFKGNVRDLALEIAIKILWPLQDYIGNVDRLILRLGGKVPKPVTLRKKVSKDQEILGDTFTGRVNDLMKKNPDFKEYLLTPNKILDKDGKTKSPTVENWINDYVHFLGAGEHSSLDRAKYIANNVNSSKLSDKYKDNLRFLFLSYDEDINLFFDKGDGVLKIEEHKETKDFDTNTEDSKINLDRFLSKFFDKVKSVEGNLISEDIIMSEAEGNVNKIRDILWNAIGIGDNDKVISCLKLLVAKRSLDTMIKEDNRFRNILKRFIGVKYGQNMERALDESLDKNIVRRLFLEMVLVDKLRLKEDQVYATAFYLSNVIPNSGQVVYLDKKFQKFQWLEIQVVANKFAWVDKI